MPLDQGFARRVQADHLDTRGTAQLGDDRLERTDRGDIPELRAAQVDPHVARAVAQIEASDAAKKSEALRLLATLKTELGRRESTPTLSADLLDGLTRTARGLEASHPRLAETVGEICRELSSLGI